MRNKIIKHISSHGAITVAEYMSMCLYDPKQGYYMTKQPFGKDGDFITAPELTPLFGEMLGLWVADTWQKMGSPKEFTLLEIGAGKGTLFLDMLRAINKALPTCLEACRGQIVEISPLLTKIQQQTLVNTPCPLQWHKSIENADFTLPTIVIGNEILDALPVHQYEKIEGNHYERLITTDGNSLFFINADKPTPINKTSTDIVEHSPVMVNFLKTITSNIKQGALLLLDYGTSQTPQGTGETLQAMRNHIYEDIFATPAHADLTWHINFTEVCDILGQHATPVADMSLFLTELGLPIRAEQAHRAAATSEQKEHIEQTTRRLLDPNMMGHHFKVIGWRSNKQQQLSGFNHCSKS